MSALSADPAKTSDLAQSISDVAALQHGLLQGHPGPAQDVRVERPAGPVRQRLLGPPGVQAAARGEPAGGGALPRGTRLAAPGDPHPRPAGRQEPAPPDLRGGRHGAGVDPNSPTALDRAPAVRDRRADHPGEDLRRPGLHPGRAGRRRVLQGLGRVRPGHRQLHVLRRVPGGRPERSARPSTCRAGGSWAGTSRRSRASTRPSVAESVAHSWYTYSDGDATPLHPWKGETNPKYTGPTAAVRHAGGRRQVQLAEGAALRGPAHGGRAARAHARGVRVRARGREAGRRRRPGRRSNVPATALFSTLGRVAARAVETSVIVGEAAAAGSAISRTTSKSGDLAIADVSLWDPSRWPAARRGLRHGGGAARLAGTLGGHRQRGDHQLPARRAQHLERVAAGRAGPPWRLGGGAGRDAGRRPRPARSRSFARSTRSIRAWPAPSTCTTPPPARPP